jgi:hypothetical protein
MMETRELPKELLARYRVCAERLDLGPSPPAIVLNLLDHIDAQAERLAALEAVVEAAREVNRHAHQPPMGLGPMSHEQAKAFLSLRDALAALGS